MRERDESAALDRLREELAAARESERHYRTLAEASHDYIFIIGRDDTVRYVNPAAAALFGRRPEDIEGRRRSELFPPHVAERQTANLQRVFQTGEPMAAEDRTDFPGGHRWLDSRLIPITDADGQVTA
ncbi:MAG: PAS domain-containing protein, partial [bacterium]